MKFEKTRAFNFDNAFRGMRNPLNSWHKSDSFFGIVDNTDIEDYEISALWSRYNSPELYEDENLNEQEIIELEDKYNTWLLKNGILYDEDYYIGPYDVAYIGPNDMELAKKLIKAGPEHRKFLRQIFVSVDITAPLYFFKEFDTYKVGTTANSTSTMHKLATTPITLRCFETDDMTDELNVVNGPPKVDISLTNFRNTIINYLEILRQKYLETKDKRYWKELVRWLPESWLQTRTITMNYENIRNICHQRQGHKLSEWESFISWAEELPYADELLFDKDDKE